MSDRHLQAIEVNMPMAASAQFCARPIDSRLVGVLLEQVLEQIAVIVESTKPNDTIAKADL